VEANLRRAFELTLGATCPCCALVKVEQNGIGLCPACAARWPQTESGGRQLPDGSPLVRIGPYRGSLRQLILRAKEEPQSPAVPVLSLALKNTIFRVQPPPGWLLVPPQSWRRRWQGWHLAAAVALQLSRQLDWPMLPLLRRCRRVQPQAGLGAAARRRNLNGVFTVNRCWQFRLKRGLALPHQVWVLDDVYTTGATWLECRRVLQASGVQNIGALMLAQVDLSEPLSANCRRQGPNHPSLIQ
jgi:predicted amidophosphoribosyltransferase